MITENTKIVDCELSIYVKKKLIDAELKTIKDISKLDLYELVKHKGFGKKSILEILAFMSDNGFYFKN